MPYQLTDLAIEAILKDWHPQNYRPPYTDVQQWIHSIESLCNLYGIPNVQRLECALRFIKEELSTELRNVLGEVRERFGPVYWDQFKNFLVIFDQEFRERWEELPFYKKHPKRTAIVVGVVSGAVLTGATIAALSYVGLTSAGLAAGSAVISYQSIAYSSATRAVLLSFQSAGTTAVMQSVGMILTGATATGAGALVATANAHPDASLSTELLQNAAESIPHNEKPNDDDGDDGNLPPYRTTASEEYLLTPRAILAIVKSWDVQTYNPPQANCTTWLDDMHKFCDQYGVPVTQRASCAVHRMSADCQEAAINAGCYNMTWDELTAWFRQHNHEDKTITNEKATELLVEKSRA